MTEEWGVEILEDGVLRVDSGNNVRVAGEPMTEQEARYEFTRWKAYGYNTTRVMRRQVTDWEPA